MSYEPLSTDAVSQNEIRGILEESSGLNLGSRQYAVTQLYEHGMIDIRKETYRLTDEMVPSEEVSRALALELGREPEGFAVAIHHLSRKGHDLPHIIEASEISNISPYFDVETPVRVVDIVHDGVEVECGQIPVKSVLRRLGFQFGSGGHDGSMFERTRDEVHLPVSVVHIPFQFGEPTYEVYVLEEGDSELGDPSMSPNEFERKNSEPMREYLNSR